MKASDRELQELADLGRIEALLGEMLRAGHAPALAVGLVPLAELGKVRVAVFGEAGGVQPPGFEGWLAEGLAIELNERHPGLRRASWDADHAHPWSVAWTDDPGPLVIWTASGARLRVVEGTVDVLDQGRWTVLPLARVARVSLAQVGEEGGLLRLHTTDGRLVALAAGRLHGAGLVARHLAQVLGVPMGTNRFEAP